jgi:aldehyde dehydrogenase (NAD+)
MKEYKLFINGEYVSSSTNTLIDDINPTTGKAFAKIHMASKEDIEAAITAADNAFKSWSKTAPKEREAILLRAADIFVSRQNEIRDLLAIETGSTFGKAMFEMGLTSDIIRTAASEAIRISGETYASNHPGMFSYSVRKPLGVVGAITPFNVPIGLASKKFAFAMAAGNTVVVKPASTTAACSIIFGEIFKEAGLPNGVFNVIPCSSSVLGEKFQEDKRVKLITFTGSTEVGKKIAGSAAANLTKFTVELGGKSSIVILNDADIDFAVDTAAFGVFTHQGQICMAGSKVIVEEGIYEQFAVKFTEKVKTLKAGDPLDPSNKIGPLIEQSQCGFIDGLIEDAVNKGAKVLTGYSHEGCFYQATLLQDVTSDMRIFHEEVFGPVATIIKAKNIDHAIEMANDTEYGLSSAVVTNNLAHAKRLSEEIEAGMLHVNGPTIMDEAHIPFGGVKDSGMGREGGHFSIEEMTELKWITIEAPGDRHYH